MLNLPFLNLIPQILTLKLQIIRVRISNLKVKGLNLKILIIVVWLKTLSFALKEIKTEGKFCFFFLQKRQPSCIGLFLLEKWEDPHRKKIFNPRPQVNKTKNASSSDSFRRVSFTSSINFTFTPSSNFTYHVWMVT